MRKLLTLIAIAVLAVAGLALQARPAAAATMPYLPKGGGYTSWTRARCEAGKQVGWWHLRLNGNAGASTQGRLYVYRHGSGSSKRVCAFAVDHLAGKHYIDLYVWHSDMTAGAWDSGKYNEYAGAIAGPSGRCIAATGAVQVGTKYYTLPSETFC